MKRIHLAARRALIAMGGALHAVEIARREYQLEELWLDLDGPVGLVHALSQSCEPSHAGLGEALADCAQHLKEIHFLFRDIAREPAIARFVETILRPGFQEIRNLIEEERILGASIPDFPEDLENSDLISSNSDRLFAVS